MSFPRYATYKETGVQWLGEVPESWQLSKLGFETWVRARLGWKGLKAEEYVEEGFALLSTPNIKGRTIDFEEVNFISQERYDESPEIKLSKGDVLLAKDGSTLGIANVIRSLPRPATVNSSIAVVTPLKNLDSVFLYYLLCGTGMQQLIQQKKGGMGVPHLFQSDIVKFPIPFPGATEQRAIASFLDRETAKIDALIAEQQRLIELLQEKRQAVISHAVTKGLNPNTPMKDSGVEWLGMVPEHWEVKRIRHLCKSIEQGWSPQCESESSEGEAPGVLKVGCVNGGIFRPTENKKLPSDLAPMTQYCIKKGDLLVSRANTRELVGSAAVAHEDFPWLYLCDKLYRITVKPDCSTANYLCLYLASREARGQIELGASGASPSMQNISQSVLFELPIPLPQQEEQENIQNAIAFQCEQTNSLIAKAREAISLFQERRSALISAAVTGQIDVRGMVSEASAQ